MTLELYRDPADYPAIFKSNLAAVSELPRRPAVAALIERMSTVLALDADVLSVHLQRHVMTTSEYRPSELRRRRGRAARSAAVLVYMALLRRRRRPGRAVPVLVDEWYDGALEGFYGAEILDRLGDAWAPVDFLRLLDADARDLVRALRAVVAGVSGVRAVRRSEGLDLTHWVHLVVLHSVVGRGLRRRWAPGVIVSGNDNGFPAILAKAAGAELVLLQNGLRTWMSDSSFVWADRFGSLTGPALIGVREATGCRLGEVRFVGSIRLARHLRVKPQVEGTHHDVLFISSLDPSFDETFAHMYTNEYELRAIELVTKLGEAKPGTVAVYPRGTEDEEVLRARGLWSAHIAYLPRSSDGVYEAIRRARLVLTTFSTAGVEALALGTPTGFLNLSGNRALTLPFEELGLVYDSGEDLDAFVERLRAAPVPADITPHPSTTATAVAELLTQRAS